MTKTNERPVVNPMGDDDVTTDEVLEEGKETIAKYADGLESTDEAVAALNATDRKLQTLRRGAHKKATRQVTKKSVKDRARRRR